MNLEELEDALTGMHIRQLAASLALKALLRESPDAAALLTRYALNLERQDLPAPKVASELRLLLPPS